MRNYVRIFRIDLTITAGMSTFIVHECGLDEQDVSEIANRDSDAMKNAFPGISISASQVYVNWLELDREFILRMACIWTQKFHDTATLSFAATFFGDFAERYQSESPKETWSNGH